MASLPVDPRWVHSLKERPACPKAVRPSDIPPEGGSVEQHRAYGGYETALLSAVGGRAMPVYAYVARDEASVETRGTVEGASVPAVLRELKGQGLRIVELSETALPQIPRGVAEADLLAFYRQLAAMVATDTPLVESLRLLAGETPSQTLSEAASSVAVEVEHGVRFSEALSRYPRLFPPTYAALVRSAETTGRLDEVLVRIADHIEQYSTLARRVLITLAYPLFICLLALGLVSFLELFVLPKFAQLFTELGVTEFPVVTQVLLWSRHVAPYFLVGIVPLVLLIILFLRLQRRTAQGRYTQDYRKLRVPLIGPLYHYAALARVSSTLGMLLGSGMGVLESIRLAAGTAGNEAVRLGTRRMEAAVAAGESLEEGMKAAGIFPGFMVARTASAEKGGNLPGAFMELGRYYDHLMDSRARTFTTIIEPVLLVLLGGAILFVVMGVFLPLVQVISQLSS